MTKMLENSILLLTVPTLLSPIVALISYSEKPRGLIFGNNPYNYIVFHRGLRYVLV